MASSTKKKERRITQIHSISSSSDSRTEDVQIVPWTLKEVEKEIIPRKTPVPQNGYSVEQPDSRTRIYRKLITSPTNPNVLLVKKITVIEELEWAGQAQ